MSDTKKKRYSLPSDPKLHPEHARVLVKWKISDGGEVMDFQSEPSSGDNTLKIDEIFERESLPLTAGRYSLSGDVVGAIEVLELPSRFDDRDRHTLARIFGDILGGQARSISDLLARRPTDQQVIEAAQSLVKEVLIDHCWPVPGMDEERIMQSQTMLGLVEPGFIRVRGTCPGCMCIDRAPVKMLDEIREEIRAQLDLSEVDLAKVVATNIAFYKSTAIGDFGQYVIKEDPEGPVVHVGFLGCENSRFAAGLNDLLAQRLDMAIRAVERDVTVETIRHARTFISATELNVAALADGMDIDTSKIDS